MPPTALPGKAGRGVNKSNPARPGIPPCENHAISVFTGRLGKHPLPSWQSTCLARDRQLPRLPPGAYSPAAAAAVQVKHQVIFHPPSGGPLLSHPAVCQKHKNVPSSKSGRWLRLTSGCIKSKHLFFCLTT